MATKIDLSTAANLEEQVYLAVLQLQQLELAVPEDTRPDNTQVDFDTEGQTVTLSVTLTTTNTISNGKAVIGVTSYLA